MHESHSNARATGAMSFITIVLKGIGQIMLQDNALTGLIFLIGISFGSINMGLAALLASAVGTATAYIFRFDSEEIGQGSYGFSPALVGVAFLLFFEPVLLTWLLVTAGSALAAVIQHFFIVKKFPVFTLPFVLVTWAVLLGVHYLYPAILVRAVPSPAEIDMLSALRGYGQVIFQGGAVAGGLFFFAVLINSPIASFYGLAAAMFAGFVSFLAGAPSTEVALGLFSYNAVLCAITFAGKTLKDGIWALISVIISIIISATMYRSHLIQLTFPFVAAACLSVAVKRSAEKKFTEAE